MTYECLYIQMCFFGAKLSFEGSLMELSGIMSIPTGKKKSTLFKSSIVLAIVKRKESIEINTVTAGMVLSFVVMILFV